MCVGGGYGWSLLSVHYLVSSFAIITPEEKESWILYFYCLLMSLITSVLCLFLVVIWVGLQCVIVEFPSHTTYFSCDFAQFNF